MAVQISIVGTEGSGKTVLASVWAKRLSDDSNSSIILHPDGKTGMHIEHIWDTLFNKGEWVPSTETGTKTELSWMLYLTEDGSKTGIPIRLIDAAGQDLRVLFSPISDYNRHSNALPAEQRALLEYVQSSSIIILVANLQDFRGEPEYIKRKENELVLKEIIDMFAADDKHQDIAVVFTAWDLYEADIAKNFGGFRDYISRELPQLWNAMRLGAKSGDSYKVITVSAVAETEFRSDENGSVFRVPKRGFRSQNLDKLTDWLVKSVRKYAVPPQYPPIMESDLQKNGVEIGGGCLGIVAGWCIGAVLGDGIGMFLGAAIGAVLGFVIGTFIPPSWLEKIKNQNNKE
jgi:GTPase SAR1 family protein